MYRHHQQKTAICTAAFEILSLSTCLEVETMVISPSPMSVWLQRRNKRIYQHSTTRLKKSICWWSDGSWEEQLQTR